MLPELRLRESDATDAAFVAPDLDGVPRLELTGSVETVDVLRVLVDLGRRQSNLATTEQLNLALKPNDPSTIRLSEGTQITKICLGLDAESVRLIEGGNLALSYGLLQGLPTTDNQVAELLGRIRNTAKIAWSKATGPKEVCLKPICVWSSVLPNAMSVVECCSST